MNNDTQPNGVTGNPEAPIANDTSSLRSELTPSQAMLLIRILTAAAFIVILNETTMINALPQLMADFRVDASAAQWLTTVFMLTMAVVMPTTGWRLERFSTRAVFIVAVAAFLLGTLLAALAPDA